MKGNKHTILVCYSSNERYIPLTSVSIQSMVEHISYDVFLDVHILHKDVGSLVQNKLIKHFSGNDNISISFDKVDYFKEKNPYIVSVHGGIFAEEAYYRLFIPFIFTSYDKCIYLDGDTLVLDDIAELYSIDLENNYIAANRDFMGIKECFDNKYNRRQYINETLNTDRYVDQIVSGIMVINNKEIRKKITASKLLEITLSKQWKYHDQDIINYLAIGRIKYIDTKWGAISIYPTVSFIPEGYGFKDSYKKPYKIIHHAATKKPWGDEFVLCVREFWETASRTPFYSILLANVNSIKKKYVAVNNTNYTFDSKPYELVVNTDNYKIGPVFDSPITIYYVGVSDNKICIRGYLRAPWAVKYGTKIMFRNNKNIVFPEQRVRIKNNCDNPYYSKTVLFTYFVDPSSNVYYPLSLTNSIFISGHKVEKCKKRSIVSVMKFKCYDITVRMNADNIEIIKTNSNQTCDINNDNKCGEKQSIVNKDNVRKIPHYYEQLIVSLKNRGLKATVVIVFNKLFRRP